MGLPGLTKVQNFFSSLMRPFPQNCADLGQAVVVGVQAGGLGIEHNKAATDRLLGLAVHRRHHIVDKVRLTAVDQLEIRVLFVDVVGREHRLRVALADAVVGDGDGAVAHAVRKAHDLAGSQKPSIELDWCAGAAQRAFVPRAPYPAAVRARPAGRHTAAERSRARTCHRYSCRARSASCRCLRPSHLDMSSLSSPRTLRLIEPL